jgi:transcriptional regulator with XRE-family HTH domain
MTANQVASNALEARRRELKMSRACLAHRSGVSAPTVYRILAGGLENAHFRYVLAIARALGMSIHYDPIDKEEPLRFRPRIDASALVRQEARRKAKSLVRMVQATSGLEGQGVDSIAEKNMVRQTVAELMAGSRRRVWSE